MRQSANPAISVVVNSMRSEGSSRLSSLRCSALAAIAALLIHAGCATGVKAAGDSPNGGSGLPLPRFVSLKSDKVNVRGGPTKDNDVTWVYTHAGLPVEITAEFENWRRIRDWEGAEGWVYHSLLSGRRTGMVSTVSKLGDAPLPIHASADANSEVVARLEPGVLMGVKRCTGTWCHVAGAGFDGWAVQNRLWGVYPNEKVD